MPILIIDLKSDVALFDHTTCPAWPIDTSSNFLNAIRHGDTFIDGMKFRVPH